jgi:hypothetical protein
MTPALPPKAKRLHLLDAADGATLYDRTIFTDDERAHSFTPVPMELALMQTFTDPAVQAFFILQLGYFKAKQRFFTVALADIHADLQWISQQINLGLTLDDLGRLRPLLKAIPLEASTSTSPLLAAVRFLMSSMSTPPCVPPSKWAIWSARRASASAASTMT